MFAASTAWTWRFLGFSGTITWTVFSVTSGKDKSRTVPSPEVGRGLCPTMHTLPFGFDASKHILSFAYRVLFRTTGGTADLRAAVHMSSELQRFSHAGAGELFATARSA